MPQMSVHKILFSQLPMIITFVSVFRELKEQMKNKLVHYSYIGDDAKTLMIHNNTRQT